jgi:hypothetical protein
MVLDYLDVIFRFTPTAEGASGPWLYLAGRTGYVQADASNTWDRLFNGRAAHATEVGCNAHGRRSLEELIDTDCRVAYPLDLLRLVYRIEHLADAREMDAPERLALRQARTRPVMEKLYAWCIVTAKGESPRSALHGAASYFVNHWIALTRFLGDGRLKPDNNLLEAQFRYLALGRKNFLFAGSDASAEVLATVYSLTRTCALRGVPPLPYLTDVIEKLSSGWPDDRIEELLPDRWIATRRAAAAATGPPQN